MTTPVNDLEMTLQQIDKRRATLESVMDGCGGDLKTETEYDALSDLRRVTVKLIAMARQLAAQQTEEART